MYQVVCACFKSLRQSSDCPLILMMLKFLFKKVLQLLVSTKSSINLQKSLFPPKGFMYSAQSLFLTYCRNSAFLQILRSLSHESRILMSSYVSLTAEKVLNHVYNTEAKFRQIFAQYRVVDDCALLSCVGEKLLQQAILNDHPLFLAAFQARRLVLAKEAQIATSF